MSDNALDDAPPAAGQSDDDILDEARKRYAQCADVDTENRQNAIDDLRFLTGGENQWDERAVAQRKADGRPIVTVNVLPTYLHQVTNDQRQNTPSIKVHPVGDKADVETAKVRQGMIRHIEYDSNADTAYDTAVNSAAAIGFGYWRLVTEYDGPTSFNQKIMYQRIRNALSVRIDPLTQQADGSDMKWCFIECLYARDEFKREWPDATATNTTIFSDGTYVGWGTDQTVLVCEYYRIETETATAILLSNGETGWKDKLEALPDGVTIKQEREGERSKVMLYKITACDVLERTEIKCDWIPVFPVYGDEVDIEGRVVRSGIIRNAKGPCQSYNVFISGATEEMALRTKAPYVGAEGQFEGHEDEWEQANNRAFPFLEYKPVALGDRLAPPPQRQPMADIPTGMLAMAGHSRDNIKATTGLFDSSIGARGTATSGIQEREQQQQGDMANFHYTDGLIRSVRQCGRCINCMIPNYYDWEGVAKIMREDDTVEHAPINQPQVTMDDDGNAIQSVLNDMTCGEYSVTVDEGPSYSTMRQESREFFVNALQAAKDPVTASVIGYLAMKNQDAPGAETAAKMMATLLPPPAKAVLEEESGGGSKDGEQAPMVDTPQGPIPAPQAGQMIAQLMQQLQQATEAVQKADGAKQQAEALKQQHLLNEQQLEPQRQATEQKKLDAQIADAEAKRQQAIAAQMAAEADLVRAHSEAATAPQRADAEIHTAAANNFRAQNELRQPIPEPEMPQEEKDAGLAQKIAQLVEQAMPAPPRSMVITSQNTGAIFEVTLQ